MRAWGRRVSCPRGPLSSPNGFHTLSKPRPLDGCRPRVRVFRSVSQAFRLIARLPRRVPGTRHLGPGTRSTPRAEYRAPKTEPGHRKTRTPGMQTPCAGFSKAGTGCGPRPWRDEGRGRCDSPTFSVQAEGRTPILPILEASGTLPAPFAFPATDPHLVPRSAVETSDGSSNG
jgi:hypothetical protein